VAGLRGGPAAAAAAALVIVLAAGLAAWLALQPPWLGLRLQPTADGGVEIAALAGPAQAALGPGAVGARLLAVAAAGGPALVLQAGDLREDADKSDSHAEIGRFYQRQGQLFALLNAPTVELHWQAAGAPLQATRVQPQARPLGSLPGAFWLQQWACAGAFLTAVWAWVQRPRGDLRAWLAVAGLGLALSVWAPSVYSARELAMEPGLFRGLSVMNLVPGMFFPVALLALLLRSPRPLVAVRHTLGLVAAVLPFTLADVGQWVDAVDLTRRLPSALLTLSLLGAAGLQWRAARRDAQARSTLRWWGSMLLANCVLYSGLVIVPPVFGAPVAGLAQAEAIAVSQLIFTGLALGVVRPAGFDFDRWSLRLLFWVMAAVAFVVLAIGLGPMIGMATPLSLGLAGLTVALAWRPVHGWLLARLAARQALPEHEMLQGVLELTLARGAAERAARWQALLQRLFQPLRIEHLPAGAAPVQPQLADEGLSLLLPAAADAPALRLAQPWGGRARFHRVDLQTLGRLLALVRQAQSQREAYDRGAQETSQRIAQDLHDDIGGRLLGALYEPEPGQVRQTVRTAIADMRSIVGALSGRAPAWDDAVAEWRAEAAQRLEAAGLVLHWPLHDTPALQLSAEQHRHLSSMLREALSNVLRHARAQQVWVAASHDGRQLWLQVRDDGRGFDPQRQAAGHGRAHLARRAELLGATLQWQHGPGTTLRIELPLAREIR
jgi:signal transduction histidine kinase